MDNNLNNNNQPYENDRNVNGEYHYIYPERANHQRTIDVEVTDENKKRNGSKAPIVIDKGLKVFLISSVVVMIALLCLLVGYFIYAVNNKDNGLNFNIPGSSDKNSPNENNSILQNKPSINIEEKPNKEDEMSAESVYDKASPSVVGVVVYDSGADIISDPIGMGSGIVISEDGYIVTNSHVVGDSTKYGIKIVLNNSEECSGKVLGFDKKTDLAVIKADKNGLTPASFGDSESVKVGSWALAIGNPGAGGISFDNSLTRGIVSAVNRSLGSSKSFVKYIQTDAAINPGNSGGGLFNMHGQIIGINSIKLVPEKYEGMGFAIPSNTVKEVVNDIISKGYVSGRVRMGMTGKMVSNYQAQIYNVPMGIIVSNISSDSDLSSKGVNPGDIVMKINDVNITSFDVYYEELVKHSVGDTVKLTIYRPSTNRSNSTTFDVNVRLLEDKGETQQQTSSYE